MNKIPSNATIVLVHAAWADASSWSAVIGPLLKADIKVIAAQIPMTSLSDDVAALKVALERVGAGPISPCLSLVLRRRDHRTRK